MKAYDPRKPLFSIHIPKCAGKSFSNILKSWFGRKYYEHYHNEILDKPPKKHNLYTGIISKKLKHGVCIHGHFNNDRGNGVYDYYPEADQIITIIRDPFDLHLSTYFYVKREARNQRRGSYRRGKRHQIVENNWSLKDYLRESKKSSICQFLPSNISLDNYQELLNEHFLYIGIMERLQNSVDILGKKLGFSKLVVPQINISDWNESIPDGSREVFIENNRLEFAVYEFSKNNFGNQLNIK